VEDEPHLCRYTLLSNERFDVESWRSLVVFCGWHSSAILCSIPTSIRTALNREVRHAPAVVKSRQYRFTGLENVRDAIRLIKPNTWRPSPPWRDSAQYWGRLRSIARRKLSACNESEDERPHNSTHLMNPRRERRPQRSQTILNTNLSGQHRVAMSVSPARISSWTSIYPRPLC